MFATAIGPSNGGRADFLRRERQLLEQRRQQLRDSGPVEPLQKIGEGYEGGKGYRFETPDNPLILTRPQPKFTPKEKEVCPIQNLLRIGQVEFVMLDRCTGDQGGRNLDIRTRGQ